MITDRHSGGIFIPYKMVIKNYDQYAKNGRLNYRCIKTLCIWISKYFSFNVLLVMVFLHVTKLDTLCTMKIDNMYQSHTSKTLYILHITISTFTILHHVLYLAILTRWCSAFSNKTKSIMA